MKNNNNNNNNYYYYYYYQREKTRTGKIKIMNEFAEEKDRAILTTRARTTKVN